MCETTTELAVHRRSRWRFVPGSARAAIKVVTTTEDLAAIAREVGGDKITVESLGQGLPGSAFRRGEAELHPEAAGGRPADRRRPRARDRLAAAAHQQSRNAEDSAGRGRLSRRLAERADPGNSDRADHARHGRRAPARQPALLAGSRERQRIAQGDRRQARRELAPDDAAYFAQRSPTSTSGSTTAEKRWHAKMAPYKGTKVVTYHRSFPNFAERFGLDIVGYVEPRPGIPPTPQHTLDLINEMKRQNVKLVLVEPYFDLKTPNAIGRETGAQVLVMPPSVGGVKEVSDYFKLFDYDINLLVERAQEDRSEVDAWTTSMLAFLAAPFVASLILTGIHAYLGVHVVERGVIFVDLSLAQIAALGATIAMLLPFIGRRSARAGASTGSAWCSPSSARACSRRSAANSARIPQEAIIGICYAVASAAAILAMSKATSRERAPEGHARRQHPGGVVAGGRQDGAALRRHRRCSTTSSGKFLAISMDHERGGGRRASRCGSGTSSSTPRSASSSPRRCRSPACCWCSAT